MTRTGTAAADPLTIVTGFFDRLASTPEFGQLTRFRSAR